MTTTEVITFANEEGLVVGASDINLEVRLRRKVVPKFLRDVGECAWRRKFTTISVVANTRDYAVATDFYKLLTPPLATNGTTSFELAYIGEDVQSVLAAEANTTPGPFAGFWFIRDGGTPNRLKKIRLDRIPDQAHTIYYAYLMDIFFVDNSTMVDFGDSIPPDLHWALVEGLRIEIYSSRSGIDDMRLQQAKDSYVQFVDDAITYREPSSRFEIKTQSMGPK